MVPISIVWLHTQTELVHSQLFSTTEEHVKTLVLIPYFCETLTGTRYWLGDLDVI